MKRLIKAFTLIELLIVIVIIGILAVALIPRLTGMQNKARFTRVDKDFQTFRNAAFLAQSTSKMTLMQISGKGCSACCAGYPFHSGSIVKNDPVCRSNRIHILRKVEQAAGLASGDLAQIETDPRGNPYLLDENDGEYGACAKDNLSTVGPDGNAYGIGIGTGDNKSTQIQPVFCAGAY